MTQALDRPAAAAPHEVPNALRLVDCDVHPNFTQEWSLELAPYFTSEWRLKFRQGDRYKSEVAKALPGVRYGLPSQMFYPKSGGNLRLDLLKEGEPLPGSDPKLSAKQLLDKNGIDRAVLIPQGIFGLGAFPNRDIAVVLARATNDWLQDKWLNSDPRWRATLVVAPQAPEESAQEIERMGTDKRFAGVFISLAQPMLGDAHYHPIYAAAERHGLPIIVHPTGTEGTYTSSAQVAGGPPAYHLDYRMSFPTPYPMSLASLIANGTFERFPDLKFVFTEVGYAWLPDFMWRMDSYWKGGREETPWVRKAPSEYIFEHVRFTTQPFIEPHRPRETEQMLEMINAERILMFSTDFPHWDSDEPLRVIAEIPERMRQRILVQNAVDVFGSRIA